MEWISIKDYVVNLGQVSSVSLHKKDIVINYNENHYAIVRAGTPVMESWTNSQGTTERLPVGEPLTIHEFAIVKDFFKGMTDGII